MGIYDLSMTLSQQPHNQVGMARRRRRLTQVAQPLCSPLPILSLSGRKEGRKEHIYLTKRQCTIHIYQNGMVRRLSLRLNIVASAQSIDMIAFLHVSRFCASFRSSWCCFKWLRTLSIHIIQGLPQGLFPLTCLSRHICESLKKKEMLYLSLEKSSGNCFPGGGV